VQTHVGEGVGVGVGVLVGTAASAAARFGVGEGLTSLIDEGRAAARTVAPIAWFAQPTADTVLAVASQSARLLVPERTAACAAALIARTATIVKQRRIIISFLPRRCQNTGAIERLNGV
jgi:hypothetical protein